VRKLRIDARSLMGKVKREKRNGRAIGSKDSAFCVPSGKLLAFPQKARGRKTTPLFQAKVLRPVSKSGREIVVVGGGGGGSM